METTDPSTAGSAQDTSNFSVTGLQAVAAAGFPAALTANDGERALGEAAAVAQRFSAAGAAPRWAAMYDSQTANLEEENFRLRRDAAVDCVAKLARANTRVLDLGCGTAPVLSELRARGIHCVGLDFSADMLSNARARLRARGLQDDELFQGDCRHTPFEAESFDSVVCLGVISYIEDYRAALREIWRVLKPGGQLLLSCRNKFNLILCDPVRLAGYATRRLRGHARAEPFVIGRFLDPREVEAAMAESGFERGEFFGIGFGPFRWNGHELLTDQASIIWSERMSQICLATGWGWPSKWMTDVSLWVYRKSAEPQAT